jgi:4-hydroxybenzoate polyprenyltransferase
MKYLRLIRLPNLVLLALSQFLVRYCIIMPAYKVASNATGQYPAHLNGIEFLLLVFSTVIIAAAGYVINDVFDTSIDEINRPGKNIIGKNISAESGKKIFFIFSAIGVVTGFALAFKIDKPVMGFVHLFSAFSLWIYSAYYKRRLLTGNLIVALLASLSLLIVGLFEPEFYQNIIYLLWYAGFAFTITFLRELIKDIEDVEGDEMAQCKTLPVRFGIRVAKISALIMVIINMALISWILYVYFYDNTVISFWNLLAIFQIPFAALFYLLASAGEKKDYHYASVFTKFIMLYGLLSMSGFWYYFLR